jgi:hypothetical protein
MLSSQRIGSRAFLVASSADDVVEALRSLVALNELPSGRPDLPRRRQMRSIAPFRRQAGDERRQFQGINRLGDVNMEASLECAVAVL